MAEARQGFGLSRRTAPAVATEPVPVASTALEARAGRTRHAGEILAFAGLIALLAGLFLLRQISGYDFIRNGWIDLPSHLAAGWDFVAPKVSRVIPSEERNEPWGAGAFTAVLWFVTFSAILRRRDLLIWLIFGFCLLPWAAMGLMVPGAGFACAMILLAGLGAAFRRKDFVRAGAFALGAVAVWSWFSLDIMDDRTAERRPAVRFAAVSTPGAVKPRDTDKRKPASNDKGERLTSMAGLDWPDNLADAKAYLMAQDGFFRGEPDIVAANLPRARAAFGTDPYVNRRLAGLDMYVLSRGIGPADAVADYKARHERLTFASYATLAIGFLLIAVGLSIEWIAALMAGRVGRLDRLRKTLDAAGAPAGVAAASRNAAPAAAQGDSIVGDSLRRIRNRIRWALGLAAPFLVGSLALAVLAVYLHVPPALSNNGFDTVHMLAPLFDNYPDGYENVTSAERMLLVPPTVWPYYLGALLSIVLLALRRLRLFLMLLALMTGGALLGSTLFPRGGVVEIAASDFKPGTIVSIDAAARVTDDGRDPGRSRKLEAYHYTLAQLAYLAGDPARTAGQLAAVGPLDFWAYPSVEWRLSIMREWVAAHGLSAGGGTVASAFVMPEDGRVIARRFAGAALLLFVLALPALLLALVHLWRHRRVSRLVDGYLQGGAIRRAGQLSRQ